MSVHRRQEIADAQHPVAMVLSCADSRVPPEHIFNVGLGDLFVIRTAGAVIDRSILATAEYGATELQVPLLVVMGHESCGAVKAAAEAKGPSESANLDYLLRAIQAARRQAPTAEDHQDREDIKALVLANVEEVINDAMAKSPLLRRLVREGKLEVVGGLLRARERPRHVLGAGAAGGDRGAGDAQVMRSLAPAWAIAADRRLLAGPALAQQPDAGEGYGAEARGASAAPARRSR